MIEDGVPRIKVIGVGSAGCQVIDFIMEKGLEHAEYAVADTDAQLLQRSACSNKIFLGENTKPMPFCRIPAEWAHKAALDDKEILLKALEGSDLIFLISGLGGGIGSGASPVVAQIAKEVGALVVAIVTKPFEFEGRRQNNWAESGYKDLKGVLNTVITIPHQRLFDGEDKGAMTLADAYKKSNNVIFQAVKDISSAITCRSLIKVDFSDVKTIMLDMGEAHIGCAAASGANRIQEAVRMAISSPLLKDGLIKRASSIFFIITGSSDMCLYEINKAYSLLSENASADALILNGAVLDESLDKEIRVTIIAGLGYENKARHNR